MKCVYSVSVGCAHGLSPHHLQPCPGTCSQFRGARAPSIEKSLQKVRVQTTVHPTFQLTRRDHAGELRTYSPTGGYRGSATKEPGRHGPDVMRYCDGCGGYFGVLAWCTSAHWCPGCRETYRTKAQRSARIAERWEAGKPVSRLSLVVK